VVVGHVAVETSHISNKIFPFVMSGTSFKRSFFKSLEVGIFEVSQKDAKESRRLIRNLVGNHLCSSPGSLGHIVGVVLFLLRQVFPSVTKGKILDSRLVMNVDRHGQYLLNKFQIQR